MSHATRPHVFVAVYKCTSPWRGESGVGWGSWLRQGCRVSYVTGASKWYWLTIGIGLLFLQQVRVKGKCFISCVSSLSYIFLFLPCPCLQSPLPSLISLFSLSLGDDTKWNTRVDVSLNTNTNRQTQLPRETASWSPVHEIPGLRSKGQITRKLLAWTPASFCVRH